MPLVAEIPVEWQKDIALVLSKFVLAYDTSLTMTPEEQKAERDREIKAAMDHVRRGRGRPDSSTGPKPDAGDHGVVPRVRPAAQVARGSNGA